MRDKIILLIAFLIILLPVYAKPKKITSKPDLRTAVFENRLSLIGMNYSDLEKVKGKGNTEIFNNQGKKEVSYISYIESWFNLPYDVRAEYYLYNDDIVQILLYFPQNTNRIDLIGHISKYLGESEQGKSDINAPSIYYSNWIKDGLIYNLQDYGKYMEMFIQKAYFHDDEDKYKLGTEPLIMGRIKADFKGNGHDEALFLVGTKGSTTSSAISNLKLIFATDVEGAVGDVVEIPKEMNGDTFNIEADDFDEDQYPDIFYSYKTAIENKDNFVIYSLKEKIPAIIFDSKQSIKGAIKLTYKDNFIIEVESDFSGKKYSLDIKDKKAKYQKDKIYKKDKLSKPLEFTEKEFMKYDTEDIDNDGAYEIRGTRIIKGADGIDNIGELTVYWKMTKDGMSYLNEVLSPIK